VLLSLSLVALLSTLVVPEVLRASAAQRLRLASRELARSLTLARLTALRRGENVAARFETDPGRRTILFGLYRDGDGDGVRNDDIERGVDPAVVQPRPLAETGADIVFGFPPGARILDPSSGRPLEDLEDPVRFNRSDLASFSPLGTATPGSVYLTDRRGRCVVVRVVSMTGLVRVLEWRSEEGRWREI